MWGMPMFDLKDAAGVMAELKECRKANPHCYIRLNGFDSTRGWETVRMSFIAQRPDNEPGYRLDRTEVNGRSVQYTTAAYAADKPAGRRYGA
jgi:ribulose-bisphosphate carboxylase small chain